MNINERRPRVNAPIEHLLQCKGEVPFNRRVLLGLGATLQPTKRHVTIRVESILMVEELCRAKWSACSTDKMAMLIKVT